MGNKGVREGRKDFAPLGSCEFECAKIKRKVQYLHPVIDTYSMKTYVLLHFEHKKTSQSLSNFYTELRTAKNGAACHNTSQVVKLKLHPLQHLFVLQSWYNVSSNAI